jgi:hypothetical protein
MTNSVLHVVCLQESFAGLDYGTVRVTDEKALPLVIKNGGKYAISYSMALRNTLAKELFTITPDTVRSHGRHWLCMAL